MNFTEQQAYLNWRMSEGDRASNYAAMGDGYKLAALRLIDSLLDDNIGHDADAVIFPVLFCAHQSIELYLKAARIAVCESMGNNPWAVKLAATHNLDSLLSSLNSCVTEESERLTQNKDTAPLFALINMLKSVGDDKNSNYYVDFSRYPEKDAGQVYLFVEDDKLVINLLRVKKLIECGCSFIDGYYALWEDRADSARATKADIQCD